MLSNTAGSVICSSSLVPVITAYPSRTNVPIIIFSLLLLSLDAASAQQMVKLSILYTMRTVAVVRTQGLMTPGMYSFINTSHLWPNPLAALVGMLQCCVCRSIDLRQGASHTAVASISVARNLAQCADQTHHVHCICSRCALYIIIIMYFEVIQFLV